MGRILALDVGDVRIGLAVSDPMGIIANPLETYQRQTLKKDLEYICGICKNREAALIICGLPKKLNDTDSLQTVKVREFADALSKIAEVPVKLFDERLTTAAAERVLLEGNVRRSDRKQVIDKVAATIILQNYLDSVR